MHFARHPTLVFFAALVAMIRVSAAETISLEEVTTFPAQQVTGITVSAEGRVFIDFRNLQGTVPARSG